LFKKLKTFHSFIESKDSVCKNVLRCDRVDATEPNSDTAELFKLHLQFTHQINRTARTVTAARARGPRAQTAQSRD